MESARTPGEVGGRYELPPNEKWQQILHLAEQLVSLDFSTTDRGSVDLVAEPFQEQQTLIVDTTQRLFGGKVELWVSPEFLSGDGIGATFWDAGGVRGTEQSQQDEIGKNRSHDHSSAGQPVSSLMQAVLESRQICYRSELAQAEGMQPTESYRVGRPDDGEAIEISLPLLKEHGQQAGEPAVFGVIQIERPAGSPFSELDIQQLESLAGQIALTMRSAAHYRFERWRRQISDGLWDAAGLLTAETSLEQVLEAILIELERSLPYDMAAIWLLDDESDLDTVGYKALQLAAMRGLGVLPMEVELGVRLGDMLNNSDHFDQENVQAVESSWLIKALDSSEPLIHQSGSMGDLVASSLGIAGSCSAISARLCAGGQTLGVMTIAHHQPGYFGRTSAVLTGAFANHAAVSIQNARLYETAHEQTWVSTVLLQVVEATREITDLYELLSSVIHITPRVAGIQACMLYLLEDESTFVPVVASGLKPEQQYEFERWHFTADDVPAFWRLIDEGAATILDEESEDWQLASILYAGLDVENLFADDLLVLVPLIIHGELLGGFLVDYSVNLLDRDDQHRMEIFFNQHLPIIEGIAHQTAVAIDNARLLKAQKEEAYVSVALLQIAQAVVSQEAIDETLEAIVRITPLLIGVKRVGIYLYDDKSCVYELVQAYGLPREFEGGQFVQMEFPLLDEVRERNQIIALPAIVNWDDAEDIHDGWIKFELPGADDVSGNLGMKKPLLIALPLSIQDEVMGVLLVEESDVIIEDLLPGEGSFMRLRSKRLEILTGVSQQTSLAVQNAYLQQDMLEHERLEREIQLAREIQRTFLPRTLPDVPGWDISVRWLTAREVGGDFYDCFLLPENKLGVVIADVADKGMPAALYMTLVRTLIRAAAREISAPADVLAWVNDILVPDAEQGMFITACYLVLSTESGQLTYANAGHNPPLWVVQKDREIQYLTKGGMALGVLEGNRVEEREILLEEGDYMILYTDGLTEAASASYELYGDERLTQTVEKAVFLSEKERTDRKELTANQFIDVLDQSVTEFIQDAPRSDDLTLVVLRRDR